MKTLFATSVIAIIALGVPALRSTVFSQQSGFVASAHHQRAPAPQNVVSFPAATTCSIDIRARDQQLIGATTIWLRASVLSCSVASNGNLAMLVDLIGFPNRGIVLAEAGGLTLVATACGDAGQFPWACAAGDPTPIGGTFGITYNTPTFVPDVNARGDVLFIADVELGSSVRGLFLYEHLTQTILKVAAIGDPTPIGGNLGAVGLGSLNDDGDVVFLAWRSSKQDAMILRWRGGVTQKVVATGDPAPTGGVFTGLVISDMGVPIGTIPIGGPSVREDGAIIFRGIANHVRGLFEEHNGQFTTLVMTTDPAPGGGVIQNLQCGALNSEGDIAFTCQIGSKWYWCRGRPGQWERVVGMGDTVDGDIVTSLALSLGGAYRPLDAAGNLLLGMELRDPMGIRRWSVVLDRPAFGPTVLLQKGDPSPMGGQISDVAKFLSMTATSTAAIGLDAITPTGDDSAYTLVDICIPPDVTVYCSGKINSAGCLPHISANGIPSASASAGFVVQADDVLNAKTGILLYSTTGSAATPFGGGVLCLKAPVRRTIPVSSGGSAPPAFDCTGVFRLDMNAFASQQLGGTPVVGLSVPGIDVYCQWWGRDPGFSAPFNVQLSDAVHYRVTP